MHNSILTSLACWITLLEYGFGRVGGFLGIRELKREGWRQ